MMKHANSSSVKIPEIYKIASQVSTSNSFKDFHGRQQYLNTFEEQYKTESEKFSGLLIYGRRRVGKSYLLQYFCRNKPTIFFQASEESQEANFNLLYSAIVRVDLSYSDKELQLLSRCNSFYELLEFIFLVSHSKRFVFVIDAYSFLPAIFIDISSEIKFRIEKYLYISKLFMILCGSNVGMMEYQVSSEAPLHEKIQQIKIVPFKFRECDLWLNQYSDEEKYKVYAVTGGL